MATSSEKSIEQYCRLVAKKQGGIAVKLVSPGNTGVPDRMLLFPGGTIGFLELKGDGGRVSRMQMVWIKLLRKLGFPAAIAFNKDEVDQFIKDLNANG